MHNFIVDTSDTYYLSDIYADIEALCDKYSYILEKSILGYSVEKREIPVLCIKSDNNPKPSVLFIGGIHGREDFSVMLVMKMLDYYLSYFCENKPLGSFDVHSLLGKVNMYFIPIANPDGLNIVHFGIKASHNYNNIKNMKIWGEDASYWKANANGVDLNKNFDDGNWDIRICVPGTDVPCSDRFKGFKSESEPETKALTAFCNSNNITLAVSYHCSGNCVFWADKGTHKYLDSFDEKIMDELCVKYIYKKTKISDDPAIYGCGFENWFRQRFCRPAFCIELSPFVQGGKQHPDALFNDLVWKYADTTGLFFAEKSLFLYEHMYDVYEGNILSKTFYAENKAVNYVASRSTSDIHIKHKGNVIWSKNKLF